MHAGVIEPGHFRFTASGETVVRLEERLGYVHRGLEAPDRGATLARAARLAGRACGDSTVAYAVAFARAVEAALDADAPARAHWLRALMAELERLANHLGDIGAICNDAAFALMHAHCGVLREQVLRASVAAFGHRLMMDCVVPGGVAVDLDPSGDRGYPRCRPDGRANVFRASSASTTTRRRCRIGRWEPGRCGANSRRASALAASSAAPRGRDFDARAAFPYPPYDRLSFEVADARGGRRECARLGADRGNAPEPRR